jgi:flagellar biosynthesis/type III secretory pathway protein FliH
MTSIAHRYADFSPFGPDGSIADPFPLERVEDQKLQAFEEGYQAGWTDAETNHAAEQKDIANEILHTLRDLSFTYHEALTRLNRGLKPMFEQIMNTLLPRTTNALLRAHVVEQLIQLAATQTDAQIRLRVSETTLAMFEDLLDGVDLNLTISLETDATLSTNQLFIALDTAEHEINLDAVCEEITTAMNAFNFHSQPEHTDA